SKDTAVCQGAHSFNLTLAGHSGDIVQWESSTVSDFSANVTTISNTTSTYGVENLNSTTYFRVLVREIGPVVTCDNYSNVVTVSINPSPNGGNLSGSDTVCIST